MRVGGHVRAGGARAAPDVDRHAALLDEDAHRLGVALLPPPARPVQRGEPVRVHVPRVEAEADEPGRRFNRNLECS